MIVSVTNRSPIFTPISKYTYLKKNVSFYEYEIDCELDVYPKFLAFLGSLCVVKYKVRRKKVIGFPNGLYEIWINKKKNLL